MCDDMGEVIELIDFFHDGMPPVDGGVLKQSATFLNAARYLKNQEAIAKQ